MKPLFERSQEYKRKIESSNRLLWALDIYSQHKLQDVPNHLLNFLGRGTSNISYALGHLELDLFLATREPYHSKTSETLRDYAEMYAQKCETYKSDGKTVSELIVGVKIHINEAKGIEAFVNAGEFADLDRYFLVVQDFTRDGHTNTFYPAPFGEECGEFDGKEIYYDFDIKRNQLPSCNPDAAPLIYKFMTDEAMIHVHPGKFR